MSKLEIFEPPMCCSSGVCGPSIDPVLTRFNSDLEWLRQLGHSVSRFNLTQQPAEFSTRKLVLRALQEGGSACLPLIMTEGKIVSTGAYPTRSEIAEWLGIPAAAVLTADDKSHESTVSKCSSDPLQLPVITSGGTNCC